MPKSVDPIERLNGEADAIVGALDSKEASLRTAADDILRRALILAIGANFEIRLMKAIETFSDKRSNSNVALCAFVRNKALSRQYHSFFDWKVNNANKFLGLFGEEFKNSIIGNAKTDSELAEGIRKFMHLGALRNELAHENFAEVKLDLTRADIIRDYGTAARFIVAIEEALGL